MSGWIWNRTRAVESLGRAYNYPHQTAVYYSMYRLAADYDLVSSQHPAVWYLQQAAATIKVPFRLIRPRFKVLQSYHPPCHVEAFQQLAWLNAIFAFLYLSLLSGVMTDMVCVCCHLKCAGQHWY